MLKLIFKNLWNRRRKYAWLFIELILVTALSWYIIDPAAVSIADAAMDLGYDADRLAVVEINTLNKKSASFSEAEADSTAQTANFERLMYKIRHYDGVERAAAIPYMSELNAPSISLNQYRTKNPADSIVKSANVLTFWPGQEYLETIGLKSMPGSPDTEELSATAHRPKKEVIITESFARMFWPDGKGTGKYFYDDEDSIKVVGVVSDFRYQNFNRTNCAVFVFWNRLRHPVQKFNVIVRLKPGTDPDSWAREFAANARRNINTGNYYVCSATPQLDIIAETESMYGISTERNTNLLLAVFFLVILVLGVIGSFYLQTRRRVTEMGVHRSFGASRRNIIAILMGEGFALTTVSFIIGDLLYLQYALKYGLDTGFGNNIMYNIINNWVTNFNEHFAIISAVVYVILMACVAIWVYLPARSVSRINPVDALRNK